MFVCERLLLTNLTAAAGHTGELPRSLFVPSTVYRSLTSSDSTVSASIVTQMTHSNASLLNHMTPQPNADQHCPLAVKYIATVCPFIN